MFFLNVQSKIVNAVLLKTTMPIESLGLSFEMSILTASMDKANLLLFSELDPNPQLIDPDTSRQTTRFRQTSSSLSYPSAFPFKKSAR